MWTTRPSINENVPDTFIADYEDEEDPQDYEAETFEDEDLRVGKTHIVDSHEPPIIDVLVFGDGQLETRVIRRALTASRVLETDR